MALQVINIRPGLDQILVASTNSLGATKRQVYTTADLPPEKATALKDLVTYFDKLQPPEPSPALLQEIKDVEVRLAELRVQAGFEG